MEIFRPALAGVLLAHSSYSRSGVGNLRHAYQAWHVERFSMAHWV